MPTLFKGHVEQVGRVTYVEIGREGLAPSANRGQYPLPPASTLHEMGRELSVYPR